MPTHSLRTADYSEAARKRLAAAVTEARRAAGHKKRPSFVRATGVKLRSLEAVELYEPVVGADALEAIGAALGQFHDNWNKDTPGSILNGGPVPELNAVPRQPRESHEAAIARSADDPAFWVALAHRVPREVFMDMWREYLLSDDDAPGAERHRPQEGWPAETPHNTGEVTSP